MEKTIIIDSREKPRAITNIISYFDKNNINYLSSKLPFGDYQNLHNPTVIVDRKQNLIEVQGNITQQHERFRAELIKAQENGFKLVILVEEKNITCLEDVKSKYTNPRMKLWAMEKSKAARKGQEFKKRPPLSSKQLYEILSTIEEKYGCKFMFCKKSELAETIIKILTNEKEII